MLVQYGQILTLTSIFATAFGGYYDEILGGLKSPDLADYLDYGNDLDLANFNMNNQVETETEAAPVAGGNIRMPTYCDPPNPCPPGYAEADGCLENFENTSEFSRRFQATQRCICDADHMFNCPGGACN